MAATIPTSNGIWTWFNEPVAAYDSTSNSTLAGWVDSAGKVWMGQYWHAYQYYAVIPLRGGNVLQVDDHVNPAVLPLVNGKFLAAYSVHNGASYAAITNTAGDIRGRMTETALADGSTYVDAYAHLCQTTDSSNTIWWFFRRGSANPRPVCFRVNQSGGTGGSWTANASCVNLFRYNGSTNRPYFRIYQSGRRIDFAITDGQPSEVSTNSLYHFYMSVSADGTQFSLYKSDDTLIDTWAISGGTGTVNSLTLPLNITDNRFTQVFSGATNKCWVWDIKSVNSSLQILYTTYSTTTNTDDTHKYRRATLSGGSWSSEDICYAGDSSSPGTVGRVPQWIYPDSATTGEINYSPGICLDPNTTDRVYIGKKYADGDSRISQWDKSGGTWSLTSTLASNSKINARPFAVYGRAQTQILWWTANPYTTYASWTSTGVTPLNAYSSYSTKSSSPTYTSAMKPPGTVGYYLLYESSGAQNATLADITGLANATIAGGSLTRTAGTYGSEFSGFSSTIAITADSLTGSNRFDSAAGYPRWLAVLFKDTDTTLSQYMAHMGLSTSTQDTLAVDLLPSAGQVDGRLRDHAGTTNGNVSVSATSTDGNYHVLMFVSTAANAHALYLDGASVGTATGNQGTYTFDRFTIGAIRRNGTQSNPFNGSIVTAIAGIGDYPDPYSLYHDLINGQFAGTHGPSGGMMFHLRRLTGGFAEMG